MRYDRTLMRTSPDRLLGLLLSACLAGCAGSVQKSVVPTPPGPPPVLTPPAVLCEDPSLEIDDFCLAARRVEGALRSGEVDILYHETTISGVTRPTAVHLGFTDEQGGRLVFRAKWKLAPPGGKGFNNMPHKELAAYEAQKLFLDEAEYVVPPTVMHCMPLQKHGRSLGEVEPTFPGTGCAFGIFAYWLEHATPEGALDLDRSRSDPLYRDALARLNLLTYLIGHRDPKDPNFLVSKDPDRPRVFTIDNGLAFSGYKNLLSFYYGDWSKIRVPMLRRLDVERLRGLTPTDIEKLGVVAEFAIEDGVFIGIEPGEPLDWGEPVRVSGDTVQFGLTRKEVDAIADRLRELLERVDAGKIETY